MSTATDAILDRLHELAGRCGHCGNAKCPDRKSHSVLPDRLRLDDVLAAINGPATPETPTTPKPKE